MKRSERTIVSICAFVLSLPFTPSHFLSLLLVLSFLSVSSTSQAQCDVKVKAGDQKTYDQAMEYYGQQQYGEASKLMRRVAQRNPKAADPQFWLGMLAVDNGFNISGIRKYFTKCISLCENYPDARAHYYMGMIHYTDERYEEASSEFNRYFQLANGSDRQEWTALYEEASAYLHWAQFLADAELHRVPFDPVPLRGVSSKRNEDIPYITPDGGRCYYLREIPVKRDRTSFYTSTTEKTTWKLFYSDWSSKDSAFDSGHELPAPFNQGNSEGAVSATADGRMLFFSRLTVDKGYPNSDIYCAKWEEGGEKWKVEKLGNGINGNDTWESQPSVSADGHWLLFASNRKGGQGGSDLWRCHRLPNGDWSRPENLGSRVNTEGNEKFPFLHADGHTLYFVSDGWQGFGGYDVYFIDLNGDSYPTNLGLPINSEDDNLSFGVTTDGLHAYFPGRVASSRSKDILYFDLYPSARPESMRLCDIKMDTPQGSRDTLLMLSEKNTNVVTFDVKGCLPTIKCGKVRELDRRYVQVSDSISVMDLGNTQVLDALAAWLIEHPRVHVVLECPKSDEAKTAYDYLIKQKKLRAERLGHRGGTAVTTKQIRLQ